MLAADRRDGEDVAAEVERLQAQAGRTQELRPGRLLAALGLLAVLAAAAIGSEAAELDKSSDALWGLTVSVVGLVVGLLGGEKAAG